jgi:hypothetical protein
LSRRLSAYQEVESNTSNMTLAPAAVAGDRHSGILCNISGLIATVSYEIRVRETCLDPLSNSMFGYTPQFHWLDQVNGECVLVQITAHVQKFLCYRPQATVM